jgi:hypothetical protein
MCEPHGAEASSVEVAANEKRKRFDALPSVEVSSEEVRAIERGDGFAQRVIGWLRGNGILGKKYVNDDTGWDNVEVNNTSVRNVIQHDAKDGKVALLGIVSRLIKDGIYLETIPKNDNGLISHVFAGKANVNGVSYAIGYLVREDNNGRRYYDHCLTKIEELDRLRGQAQYGAPRYLHELQGGERHVTSTQKVSTENDMTTDKKSLGTLQRTRPSSNPTGEESLSNILKKHLRVNRADENI